ncbi:MAG: SEC-C domain-containing protein, partial [Sandaracinaceae bacterium]|nr:SEC-C domain-containing protein [Sandaracinaceae bacterium]
MDVGRNDLCPCGSGKKYKKCCLDTDAAARSRDAAPAADGATAERLDAVFAD